MPGKEYCVSTETDQTRTKVYLMPPLVEKKTSDLNVLVLTDGNNRAKGLNQGYDEGGKNVVAIAEHLAQRRDVCSLIACIMSKENFEKRSEEFFQKMYQAFVALGIRISSRKQLVKAGIRMEVAGDLEKMRRKNRSAKDLADMIQTVCDLTTEIEEPQLRLILGVNYDQYIALNYDADIIYRSGMEERDCLRLSGLRTHRGIGHYGSTTLWPNVGTGEIDEIIDRSKQSSELAKSRMTTGYDSQKIIAIIENLFNLEIDDSIITIPYYCSPETITKIVEEREIVRACSETSPIELFDNSEISKIIGDSKTAPFIQLIPFYQLELLRELKFKAFIAPGQTESTSITLPEKPDIEYATVHACQNNPEAICHTIKKAVEYSLKYTPLLGSERPQNLDDSKQSTGHSLEYYTKFISLVEHTDGQSVFEIAQNLDRSQRASFENDNDQIIMMDLMIARFLVYAKRISAPIETPEKLNAYINYVIISFFIAYNPIRKGNSDAEKTALENTEWLVKYMQLVYAGDEAVFDMQFSDENAKQKLTRIRKASVILSRSITSEDAEFDSTYDYQDKPVIQAICEEWQEFKRYYQYTAHQQVFDDWKANLVSLYQCSVCEYDPAVINNRLITDLECSNDYLSEFMKIRDQYFHKTPAIIKQRIEKIFSEISRLDPNNIECRKKLISDLKNLLYLTDIRTTIGAGLVLRTSLLTISKDEITTERAEKINEICNFFDYYVRVANDLSDYLKRSVNDRDQKEDICTLNIAYYEKNGFNHAISVLKAITDVKNLYDWLQKQFESELTQLRIEWPLFGEIFDRADYVKNLYQIGHFRTEGRKSISEFLKKHQA
jgi:hypothetical protein